MEMLFIYNNFFCFHQCTMSHSTYSASSLVVTPTTFAHVVTECNKNIIQSKYLPVYSYYMFHCSSYELKYHANQPCIKNKTKGEQKISHRFSYFSYHTDIVSKFLYTVSILKKHSLNFHQKFVFVHFHRLCIRISRKKRVSCIHHNLLFCYK